jgi:hypothetical protein
LEHALTALKIVTALGGVFGYVIHTVVLAPEVQDHFIYKDRNPLYGDAIKYALYAVNFCLVACAFCPWWKLSATPMWAWASVFFSGVVYLLYAIESKFFYRKLRLIGLFVRVCISGLITLLTHAALNAANA